MHKLLALPITNYHVEFTITQGRGLVAKDRHFLTGQRTTSDPYAVVYLGMDQRLGRTPTSPKTLSPVWNTTFHVTVPNKRHAQVPKDLSTFLGSTKQNAAAATEGQMMDACGMVLIKLYDEDDITDDDMMGTVLVPIPASRETIQSKRWYKVDNLFVHNAVGDIEVSMKVTPEMGKRSKNAKDLLPSPETFSKWTGKLMGKKETVNEHNVVIEAETDDRKGYILAMLKKFAE